MKTFSHTWNSSKQRRKQRKYRNNAPLHIKQKFMAAHLSKDLKKKYNTRSLTLRKGYIVKIMRGQFNKKSGKIMEISLNDSTVHVEGIQQLKRDGTKTFFPIQPSNLQIIEAPLEDKKKRKKLEAKVKK